MKKIQFIALSLIASMIIVSCEGPEGPAGPTGPIGPSGQNGNEEVLMFTYGPVSLDAVGWYNAYYTFGSLTKGKLDSSVILIYYSAYYSQWNVANGMGPDGDYATIQYFNESDSTAVVYLKNADGTTYSGSDVTWDSTKIFVIPASEMAYAQQNKINFSDMRETQEFFGLK